MPIHETVRLCPVCGEVTPHSRRAVALPRWAAATAALAAGTCFLSSEPWWLLGGLLLVLAAFLVLWDRDRYWNVACERCRGKRVAEVRASNPRLGSTTIIDPF